MKIKYQTVYETSYGTVKAQFKEEVTFEEAEAIGKKYCKENNLTYVKTELC